MVLNAGHHSRIQGCAHASGRRSPTVERAEAEQWPRRTGGQAGRMAGAAPRVAQRELVLHRDARFDGRELAGAGGAKVWVPRLSGEEHAIPGRGGGRGRGAVGGSGLTVRQMGVEAGAKNAERRHKLGCPAPRAPKTAQRSTARHIRAQCSTARQLPHLPAYSSPLCKYPPSRQPSPVGLLQSTICCASQRMRDGSACAGLHAAAATVHWHTVTPRAPPAASAPKRMPALHRQRGMRRRQLLSPRAGGRTCSEASIGRSANVFPWLISTQDSTWEAAANAKQELHCGPGRKAGEGGEAHVRVGKAVSGMRRLGEARAQTQGEAAWNSSGTPTPSRTIPWFLTGVTTPLARQSRFQGGCRQRHGRDDAAGTPVRAAVPACPPRLRCHFPRPLRPWLLTIAAPSSGLTGRSGVLMNGGWGEPNLRRRMPSVRAHIVQRLVHTVPPHHQQGCRLPGKADPAWSTRPALTLHAAPPPSGRRNG